ncbi:deoxyribonuclease gamma-like isoform X2 [Scyliorhinus canicula]|uniref:deoxyribonuclease gamma-like isoform X2 n=1 Tax=Scyliorhinus canicula TaxID=7830 RepID=UPI0018F6495B|nr:deoxyribonuclease gamma-like isoform X2 [Scyliorhinus canicula]
MKIAAFNIRRLGISKISKPEVVSTIVNILLRYDITLIMEVTDKTGTATKKLLEELNNDDVVQVERRFQYKDMQPGDEDAFSREPFVIQFKSQTTAVQDFVLIPQHTCPDDSVKEIDELYDVFLKIKKEWHIENIMILGDFNADGRYVSKKKMKTIRLRKDKDFHWLIGDDEDTMASLKTDEAYDRIVVYGDTFYQGIVPNSAKPFNFQEAWKLTEQQALEVSDHYPIEVELRLIE